MKEINKFRFIGIYAIKYFQFSILFVYNENKKRKKKNKTFGGQPYYDR